MADFLHHLNQMSCPICGSELIKEEKGSIHSNGHREESQSFECGFKHRYEPSFMGIRVTEQCPQHVSQMEKRQKLEAVKNALDEVLRLADIDEELKYKVKNYGWQYI